MIDPHVWQEWCGRALVAKDETVRTNCRRFVRDWGVDHFNDSSIYFCYSPTGDNAWAKSIKDKLKKDVKNLLRDSYRAKLDQLLTNVCARRVVLLVPEVKNPSDANIEAENQTKRLRSERGGRSWLSEDVIVTVVSGVSEVGEHVSRRVNGEAFDPEVIRFSTSSETIEGFARFQFQNQWLPFVGRVEQLEEIAAFRDENAKFTWKLIYGHGGVGKSRLALEACKEAGGKGWHAGFLHVSSLQQLTDRENGKPWQPAKPCFLVIDYPSEAPNDVAKFIKDLSDRHETLSYPVRILLLDRGTTGPWIEKLGLDRSSSGAVRISRRNDHELPNSSELLPKILDEVYNLNQKRPPSKAEISEFSCILHNIAEGPDGGVTFLAAILLADAMARQESFGFVGLKPTAFEIYKMTIERELRIWDTAGFSPNDKALIVLATLVGGISIQEFGVQLQEQICDGLPLISYNCCEIVGGVGIDRNSIPMLRPDPLGEAYIAIWLREYGTRNPILLSRLCNLAWTMNANYVAVVLCRCATDLPIEVYDDIDVALKDGMGKKDIEVKKQWAMSVQYRCGIPLLQKRFFIESEHKNALVSEKLYDSLQNNLLLLGTIAERKVNVDLFDSWVGACCNFARIDLMRNDILSSVLILEEIDKQLAVVSETGEATVWAAQLKTDIGYQMCLQNDFRFYPRVLSMIEKSLDRYFYDHETVIHLGRGLVNCLLRFTIEPCEEQADIVFEALRRNFASRIGEDDFKNLFAHGMAAYLCALVNCGALTRVQEMHARLLDLASSFPEDKSL